MCSLPHHHHHHHHHLGLIQTSHPDRNSDRHVGIVRIIVLVLLLHNTLWLLHTLGWDSRVQHVPTQSDPHHPIQVCQHSVAAGAARVGQQLCTLVWGSARYIEQPHPCRSLQLRQARWGNAHHRAALAAAAQHPEAAAHLEAGWQGTKCDHHHHHHPMWVSLHSGAVGAVHVVADDYDGGGGAVVWQHERSA